MMDKTRPYFLESTVVGELQINCYLFGCRETMAAAIIDPGGDPELIEELVTNSGAAVKMILLTHGHYDHIGALNPVRTKYGCPVLIHAADEDALINPMVNLSALTGQAITCEPAEQILEHGDKVSVGKLKLDVIHTPGHTPGGVCFRFEEVVFDGDLVFFGSVGRTDLPGGSHEQLESSIRNRIYTLPDDTLLFPGHGEPTTVGYEKKHNAFVRAVV